MSKKAVKITISDFPENDFGTTANNFIISQGGRFPSKFVLNQPNMLDGVAFFICVQGTARVKINYRDYDVDPNTVLVILPNHVFEALSRSDDFQNVLLTFSLDFVTGMPVHLGEVKQLGENPLLHVSDDDKQILLDMHDLIVKMYSQAHYPLREEIARSLLYTLSLQLKAIHGQAAAVAVKEKPSRQSELTEHFMRLLVDNFKRQRMPAFYADKLCVTAKYLSQVVHSVTGESVFAWINKMTIVSIKNTLKTTTLSIAQISEALNFPNPSYFGRYFKQHTGMTPGQYRKDL